MKKILAFLLLSLLLAASLFSFTSCSVDHSTHVTLYVYNWGEYISDGSEDSLDVNALFEEWYYQEYGVHVKVNYSTFSSNESLYAKLESGSVRYDVIVPSDYMIERMIAEDIEA